MDPGDGTDGMGQARDTETGGDRRRTRSGRSGLRELVRHYLPDLIYGANDGIVTTLAVVSGVVGAALSARIILILGFANLLADGVSMGASNYLSRRSGVGEPPDRKEAAQHGLATLVGFIIAGVMPLVAYVVPLDPAFRFQAAVALAMVTLFTIGAGRSLVTPLPWFRAGMEMLLVGAAAAGVAYGIGALGARVVGGPAAP